MMTLDYSDVMFSLINLGTPHQSEEGHRCSTHQQIQRDAEILLMNTHPKESVLGHLLDYNF